MIINRGTLNGYLMTGSGTSGYSETLLYSATADSANITLAESFENFDLIKVIAAATTAQGDYRLSTDWPVSYLKQHINDNVRFGITGDAWYLYFSISDNISLVRNDRNILYFSEIIGIKY